MANGRTIVGMVVAGGLAAGLAACHSGGGAAERSGAPRPDVDPNLAVTTALVAHGCSNCHAADYARVGPAMTDVAAVYAAQPAAPALLAASIVNGVKGKWGEAAMPPQHQMTPAQADAVARVILAARPAATG